MKYLEEMRKVENILIDEGCLGETPFTTRATSRDYYINVYNDGLRFYLPELKIFFKLQLSDILVFKPSEVQYCTRRY
jgi:hypothetical protein